MCPAFVFLPDKNNTTSIETPCCFIQRKTPVRICPLPKAGFSNGFSGGKKYVWDILKYVRPISKYVWPIFSLLGEGDNFLNFSFQFSGRKKTIISGAFYVIFFTPFPNLEKQYRNALLQHRVNAACLARRTLQAKKPYITAKCDIFFLLLPPNNNAKP